MSIAVELEFGSDGARSLALGPLTGAEEREPLPAAQLLRRLAQPGAGRVAGATVDRLTVGDRDRALAALYAGIYGDAVAADVRCATCGGRHELRFLLSELARSRRPDGRATGDPPTIALGRTRLRLPVVADLEGPAGDLVARLVLQGPVPEADVAAAALEAADPALELDLTGACPDCGTVQAAAFSISRFLEAAFARDREFLWREAHLIASAYHWSLAEILSLTRSERQSFARLLIGEREAASQIVRRAS